MAEPYNESKILVAQRVSDERNQIATVVADVMRGQSSVTGTHKRALCMTFAAKLSENYPQFDRRAFLIACGESVTPEGSGA